MPFHYLYEELNFWEHEKETSQFKKINMVNQNIIKNHTKLNQTEVKPNGKLNQNLIKNQEKDIVKYHYLF